MMTPKPSRRQAGAKAPRAPRPPNRPAAGSNPAAASVLPLLAPILTDRLRQLREKFLAHDAAAACPGPRHVSQAAEVDARNQAYLAACRATVGEPAICRRARLLEEFAESALIRLEPDTLLAGSLTFNEPGFPAAVSQELTALGYASHAGPLVHDYAALLQDGIAGLLTRLCVRRETVRGESEQRNLDAFIRALLAFRRFIYHHAEAAEKLAPSLSGEVAAEWQGRAEDLNDLAILPPKYFRQALQLAWFMQLFLQAENPAAALSFGRLDQNLWPFLRRDLESGTITPAAACDLIGAFFLCCGAGANRQSLMLGGVDTQGRDSTNPLSILMLDMMRELRLGQPALAVRQHPLSPPALLQAASNLAATGTGQPEFLHDETVIPGLLELGMPLDRARDYRFAGSAAAYPQDEGYPALSLTAVLDRYLNREASRQAAEFSPFLDGWYRDLDRAYCEMLTQQAQPTWNRWREQAPSPFGSVVTTDCIEHARPLEAGHNRFNLFSISILGLAAVADTLHAIREQVFTRRDMTVAQFAAAMAGNVQNKKSRPRPERFDAEREGIRALANELAIAVARMVRSSRMDNGVRPYPVFCPVLVSV